MSGPVSGPVSGSPAVRVRGLRFSHPERAGGAPFTLSLASWTLAAGARAAVLGPSGCGKSTLMDLIAGALPVSAGELEVVGAPLHRLDARARRSFRAAKVGFVLQGAPLIQSIGVTENVLLPYRLSRALSLDAAARRRAWALLEALDLSDKADARPATLSQGERQRVALARAVVTEPPLLLADEPTAGLDPARAQVVVELLEQQAARLGSTLILVTHDPALAARFPERLDLGATTRAS